MEGKEERHYGEITMNPGERFRDVKPEKAASGERKNRRRMSLTSAFRASSRRLLLADDDDDDERDLTADLTTEPSMTTPLEDSSESLGFNGEGILQFEPPTRNRSKIQLDPAILGNDSLTSHGSNHNQDSLGSSMNSIGSSQQHTPMQSPVHPNRTNRKVRNKSFQSLGSPKLSAARTTKQVPCLESDIEDDEKEDASEELGSVPKKEIPVPKRSADAHRNRNHDRSPNDARRIYRNSSQRQSRRNRHLSSALDSSNHSLEGFYPTSKAEPPERSARRKSAKSKSEVEGSPHSSASKLDDSENNATEEVEFTSLKTSDRELSRTSSHRNLRPSRHRSVSNERLLTKNSDHRSSRRKQGVVRSSSGPEFLVRAGSETDRRNTKSGGRRIKRTHTINTLTSKSQEGMKILYGQSGDSSDNETHLIRNISQKQISEEKVDDPTQSINHKENTNDALTKSEIPTSPLESDRAERRRRRIEEVTRGKSHIQRRPQRRSSTRNLKTSDHRSTRKLGRERPKRSDVEDSEGKRSKESEDASDKNNDSFGDNRRNPSLIDLLSNHENSLNKTKASHGGDDDDDDSLPPPSLAPESEYKETSNRSQNVEKDQDSTEIEFDESTLSFAADWDTRVSPKKSEDFQLQPIPDLTAEFASPFETFDNSASSGFPSDAITGTDSLLQDGVANSDDVTKKKKRGMLKKMRKGLSEGGRATVKKAASTRNLFEQTTMKAFARGTEEGKGLLRSNSDD